MGKLKVRDGVEENNRKWSFCRVAFVIHDFHASKSVKHALFT